MSNLDEAKHVVEAYFQATYHGDAEEIKKVFHERATVSGYVGDAFYSWTVDEFVNNITSRPIAANCDEIYDKQVLAVDVTDRIARVKARNLVSDTYFIDQMNVACVDGVWLIINKLFTSI
jgi:ketosteroid isomerase-like protein